MTTLAADKPRAYMLGELNDLPVIAADIIYEGAAVGDNASGYARPLTAGDPFRGFALERCDNSAGAAGAKKVRLRQAGTIDLPVTGVDGVDDIGKAVFASDDDTFTTTQGSNSFVGRIIKHVSGTTCTVAFDARGPRVGALTELTDNSTGSATDTIASISDSATKNAIASIAAKVNALIRRGN